MSKPIGFRCPDDVLVEIERNVQLTGLDKTTVIIEMIKGLQGISINDRKKLPEVEAIYLVWTKSELLYIGQTTNIQKTFTSHHRLVEFLNAEARVSWFDPSGCDRLEVEGSLINILTPTLNEIIVTGGNRRIDIIVTEKEFQILKQYCEDNGQTKTAVIQELIRTLGAHTAN